MQDAALPVSDDTVPARAWGALAVASSAAFMASLDAMVLYVAFHDIRADFPGVSAAALSWILSGYTIVVAAGMIGAGRWADRLGRRRVFLGAVSTFTLASALCALAGSTGMLIGARILQGIGAAALTPASLALVLHGFPRRRVPQAIALYSAAGALAAALGPTIGGLLVEAWGWRSVFIANLPVGLAIAVLGPRLLDESREPAGSALPDPLGALLITLGLVGIALGVVQSDEWGWSDPRTLGALAGGLVTVAAFVLRCARVSSPVLDLTLFRDRSLRWANLGQVVYATGFTVMFFGNVQLLGEVWHYSPVLVGLAMAPGPLMVFLLAPRFGRLAGRIGPRPILIAGGAVYAASCLMLLVRFPATPHYLEVWLPYTLLSGTGVAMTFPMLTAAAVSGLPPARLATGSALSAALRALGQTLGVAVVVAVVGRASGPQLLERYPLAWQLAACCGMAVSLAALRLPRAATTPAPARAELASPAAAIVDPGP